VDAHGVPGAKFGDVVAQLRGLDVIERVHGILRKGKRTGMVVELRAMSDEPVAK
jgi:hypothetical protein